MFFTTETVVNIVCVWPNGLMFHYNFIEIDAVNEHLDSLNSALDAIEQRNDDIRAQLLDLLHSNREIRESMQQQQAAEKSKTDAVDKANDDDDSKMQ